MRIEPSTSIRFTGPVVILMSNNTVSSGEELPLILKGLPYVTLLGDTSPGALSDIQMKSLPNGAVLGLPNEVVMSADGENYDARGIAPDVARPSLIRSNPCAAMRERSRPLHLWPREWQFDNRTRRSTTSLNLDASADAA